MGAKFAPIPSAIRYDIYGNIETPLSQEDKTFGYNTLEYTPQNKLTYIRARYYDSTSAIFITKDTYLGNIYKPNTTNRYAYCSGDPVNYMDLDGHRMVIYDDSHGRPVCAPPSKPSTGSTKTNTGTKKSSGGSSSYSGGSSSYDDDDYSPPPPPNPVEKYIKPSIFDKLKATVSSAVDSIKNTLKETKINIKSIVTNSSKTTKTVSVLKTVTTIASATKSITETVINTCNNIARDAFNALPDNAQDAIRTVSQAIDNAKATLATTGTLITALGIATKTIGNNMGNLAFAGGGSPGSGLAISVVGEALELTGMAMVVGAAGVSVLASTIENNSKNHNIENKELSPDELEVLDKKYLDDNGNIDWEKYAPNGGRIEETIQKNQTLEPGEIIDRYGPNTGKYTSPYGTTYSQRSLPYIENTNAYHKYRVIKPINNVTKSQIAPAFEQEGLGWQYELPNSVNDLLGTYLEEIK